MGRRHAATVRGGGTRRKPLLLPAMLDLGTHAFIFTWSRNILVRGATFPGHGAYC